MIATNKETPKEVMVILSQYSASKCNTVKSISVKEKYLKKSNCFRETVVETVSSVVLFILFPEVSNVSIGFGRYLITIIV